MAYWRTQRRMSQQLLADLLGRSKSWVEKIERGQRALDKYSVVHHIAHVLQVDLALLLNGHPDPGSAPAPHQPTPPAAPLNLAAARRHVDILIRHHLPPPPPGHTTDPNQTDTLRRLLTLVYAAMTAEHIEPPIRHRVIAAVCTQRLPSASTRPQPGRRAHRATR